jgi:hypothetical protein
MARYIFNKLFELVKLKKIVESARIFLNLTKYVIISNIVPAMVLAIVIKLKPQNSGTKKSSNRFSKNYTNELSNIR